MQLCTQASAVNPMNNYEKYCIDVCVKRQSRIKLIYLITTELVHNSTAIYVAMQEHRKLQSMGAKRLLRLTVFTVVAARAVAPVAAVAVAVVAAA